MLLVFVFLAIVMPFAANTFATKHSLKVADRRVLLPLVGAELVMIGYALTPGVGWGEPGEHQAINALSTMVWVAGVVVLILAAIRWLGPRQRR